MASVLNMIFAKRGQIGRRFEAYSGVREWAMPYMDGGVTRWVEDSYAQVPYSKQAVSEKKTCTMSILGNKDVPRTGGAHEKN